MRELIDRLESLDPAASESIKVIIYFDTLLDGRAGPEAFLRGAAILTDCAAGAYYPARRVRMRVDRHGVRTDRSVAADAAEPWLSQPIGDDHDARVWIERDGAAHANDALVLERLASGLHLTLERSREGLPADEGAALETLVDAGAAPAARDRAAGRLRLRLSDTARVVATPPSGTRAPRGHASTVLATPVGPVRATLERGPRPADERPGLDRAGLGRWGAVADLPASWGSAVLALRLTAGPGEVLDGADVGAFALLADGLDRRAAEAGPVPEVVVLDGAAENLPWAIDTLEAVSAHESVRAAATALGIHHSTAQSRLDHLERALGYDPRSRAGRTRLAVELALRRLTRTRFA